jgi:hypothetical protein
MKRCSMHFRFPGSENRFKFERWNPLLFLFLCCSAARASTISTSCGTNFTTLTGANISSSCNGSTYTAAAALSTSTSETTASVSAFGVVQESADGLEGPVPTDAFASFTIDETWLILGGTGSAELHSTMVRTAMVSRRFWLCQPGSRATQAVTQ